jgi:hypothetical protein
MQTDFLRFDFPDVWCAKAEPAQFAVAPPGAPAAEMLLHRQLTAETGVAEVRPATGDL